MQGIRRDNPNDELPKPGEYGKGSDGKWYGCPPQYIEGDDLPLVGNLSAHQVVEHEDGTITVSPSILIRRHNGHEWHGFLEHGVWREA
jgi:hypothetical protein